MCVHVYKCKSVRKEGAIHYMSNTTVMPACVCVCAGGCWLLLLPIVLVVFYLFQPFADDDCMHTMLLSVYYLCHLRTTPFPLATFRRPLLQSENRFSPEWCRFLSIIWFVTNENHCLVLGVMLFFLSHLHRTLLRRTHFCRRCVCVCCAETKMERSANEKSSCR